MKQAIVIPDIQIARLEDELELMRLSSQNLLKLQVCEARLLVVVIRRKQRACQIGVPAHAFDLAGVSRLQRDGHVGSCLV